MYQHVKKLASCLEGLKHRKEEGEEKEADDLFDSKSIFHLDLPGLDNMDSSLLVCLMSLRYFVLSALSIPVGKDGVKNKLRTLVESLLAQKESYLNNKMLLVYNERDEDDINKIVPKEIANDLFWLDLSNFFAKKDTTDVRRLFQPVVDYEVRQKGVTFDELYDIAEELKEEEFLKTLCRVRIPQKVIVEWQSLPLNLVSYKKVLVYMDKWQNDTLEEYFGQINQIVEIWFTDLGTSITMGTVQTRLREFHPDVKTFKLLDVIQRISDSTNLHDIEKRTFVSRGKTVDLAWELAKLKKEFVSQLVDALTKDDLKDTAMIKLREAFRSNVRVNKMAGEKAKERVQHNTTNTKRYRVSVKLAPIESKNFTEAMLQSIRAIPFDGQSYMDLFQEDGLKAEVVRIEIKRVQLPQYIICRGHLSDYQPPLVVNLMGCTYNLNSMRILEGSYMVEKPDGQDPATGVPTFATTSGKAGELVAHGLKISEAMIVAQPPVTFEAFYEYTDTKNVSFSQKEGMDKAQLLAQVYEERAALCLSVVLTVLNTDGGNISEKAGELYRDLPGPKILIQLQWDDKSFELKAHDIVKVETTPTKRLLFEVPEKKDIKWFAFDKESDDKENAMFTISPGESSSLPQYEIPGTKLYLLKTFRLLEATHLNHLVREFPFYEESHGHESPKKPLFPFQDADFTAMIKKEFFSLSS